MNKPVYPIETTKDGLWYEFDSISNEKIIRKAVAFYNNPINPQKMELVFGDLLQDGTIDVFAKSNNKDMNFVLLTVAYILDYFFELYPSKCVIFMGSTPARNRIYRVLIAKLSMQRPSIRAFGITFDDNIVPFEPNQDYFSYQICLIP
jgi:hypothetical protein